MNLHNALTYAFDDYVLTPGTRSLTRGGSRVAINAKAFDVLLVLVAHAGRVVANRDVLRQVWHSDDASQSGLRVQVTILRKLLAAQQPGRRYIECLPGKGYCFVAPVRTGRQAAAGAPGMQRPYGSADALYGRDAAMDRVIAHLHVARLVTLTGAGGVGKTALARAVAHRMAAAAPLSTTVVDIASQPADASPNHVADGVMAALHGHDGSGGRQLIVLENCEYATPLAARLAQELAAALPQAALLAIGRLPLCIQDEHVVRLDALALPPGPCSSLAAALRYPAIRMFCGMARKAAPALTFGDADVAAIVSLCSALDGLPLALEMAAAQLPRAGLRELLEREPLDYVLDVSPDNNQDERHRTLRHCIDWNYQRLGSREQRALHRLALFRHGFGLLSARTALAGIGIPDALVLATLHGLVANAMLSVTFAADATYYSVANTIRTYVLDARRRQRENCRPPYAGDPRDLPAANMRQLAHL